MPVVAAVKGAVIGGGLELAAAAHLRVAERSAFYALPEGQRGLFVGGGGSVRVPRLIGLPRTTDMLLTGRVLDATEAQDFGISNYLVDHGLGLERALELATAVARNSPISNFAVLQALPRIADANGDHGYFIEALMASTASSSDEAQRRMDDFLSGRAAKVGLPRPGRRHRVIELDNARAPTASHSPASLWEPPADWRTSTLIGQFATWSGRRHGLVIDSYDDLWQWSVGDVATFWTAVWDYFGVRSSTPRGPALVDASMPGARWFTGASVNYSRHLLEDGDPDRRHDSLVAVMSCSQTRDDTELTFGELRDEVARARAGLLRLGVARGDRVVAYLPNISETVVAFLACASIGAVWASCAPEFGTRSVVDRFAQVEPTVLIGVTGYWYGDKRRRPARGTHPAARAAADGLRHLVHVPYGEFDQAPDGALAWASSPVHPPPRLRRRAVRPPAVRPVQLRHDGPAEAHRPRARWDPARAPQEPRPELGPRCRRPAALVHHHRLDDVERPRLGTPPADRGRLGRRQPDAPGSRAAVGPCGSHGHHGDGTQPRIHHGHTRGGARPRFAARSRPDPTDRRGRQPAAPRGLSVGRPPLRGRAAQRRERRNRRLLGDRAGQPAAVRGRGRDLRALPGGRRLCVRRERPRGGRASSASSSSANRCRPCPWGSGATTTGRAIAPPTSTTFPACGGTATSSGSPSQGRCVVAGRSDATLNRGGVRLGTAEFYQVVEELPEVADSLVVHLEDDQGGMGRAGPLCRAERPRLARRPTTWWPSIRKEIRTALSPRHLPDEVVTVPVVPRNRTGKKLELPVKRILLGDSPDRSPRRARWPRTTPSTPTSPTPEDL